MWGSEEELSYAQNITVLGKESSIFPIILFIKQPIFCFRKWQMCQIIFSLQWYRIAKTGNPHIKEAAIGLEELFKLLISDLI